MVPEICLLGVLCLHSLQDHDLKVCAEFANFGAARVVETFGPRLTKNGYQETLKSFQKS